MMPSSPFESEENELNSHTIDSKEGSSILVGQKIASITALPVEIWDQIMFYSDRASLAAFVCANSTTREMVSRHLYTSILLPKTDDSTQLLKTLASHTTFPYASLLRTLDIPINATNCEDVNLALGNMPQLSNLKLKVRGPIGWPFGNTRLNLSQFHWESMLQKVGGTALEHAGGDRGLSKWLDSQPNIIKLKLVTQEKISLKPDSLPNLIRASGPMFIVSVLVPYRPVTTVQVTPRSRDPNSGLTALGQSTGPLKHLKVVSRPELDHFQLLRILSETVPSLETLAFEICGQVTDMGDFLSRSLIPFPSFPELQVLSISCRITPQHPVAGLDFYRSIADKVQRTCPTLRRIHFPGVIATLVQRNVVDLGTLETNRSS